MEKNSSKLKFFILQKKCFVKLIEKFTYIIDIYDSLLESDRFTDQPQFYMNQIDLYIREKNNIINRLQDCEENICKLCNHYFIEDVVDNAYDSYHIRYCTYCEYSEKI